MAPRKDQVEQSRPVDDLLVTERGGLDGPEEAALGDREALWSPPSRSFPITAESRAMKGSSSSRVFQTSPSLPAERRTGDLGHRERVVEPMERLAGDDVVCERVRKRDDLGAAEDRTRAGSRAGEEVEHLRQRLDGRHSVADGDERATPASPSRPEIDDVPRLVADEPANRVLRVSGRPRS